jgi:Tol biopolymer transport system component
MKQSILSRRLVSLLIVATTLTVVLAGCATPHSAQSEGLAGDRVLFVTFQYSSLSNRLPEDTSFFSFYIVNADGTKLSKLVDVETGESGRFVWSPCFLSLSCDRKRVAYFSSEGYLSILNIDDGKVTKLKETGQQNGDRYVAWSPDDSRIAYVDGSSLHLINADGTDDRELASRNRKEYYTYGYISDRIRNPIWSADGTRILFDDFTAPPSIEYSIWSGTPAGEAKNLRYRAVYAVDIDSGEKSKVFDKAVVRSPTSYYGKKVLVEAWSEEDFNKWFVMNDDGTARKEFPVLSSREQVGIRSLSPDGSAIAYLSTVVGYPDDYDLKMIDTTTGEDIPVKARLKSGGCITWSPDSQHIAYVTGESGNFEIHIVRRDLSCGFLAYRLSDPNNPYIDLVAWVR